MLAYVPWHISCYTWLALLATRLSGAVFRHTPSAAQHKTVHQAKPDLPFVARCSLVSAATAINVEFTLFNASVSDQLSYHSYVVQLLQAGEDPFGDQQKEKKARIASQEGRQLKNKQASNKIHGKPVLPPTLKLAASLPEHGKGVPTKRRELKADVRHHTVMYSMCRYQLCQCMLAHSQYA